MPDKKKFKAKLREKFAGKAKKANGRSLAYAEMNAENHYGKYKEVTLPESQRSKFNTKIKEAMKTRAQEILSEGGKAAKDSAKEVHKGLTGIRHPAQLIPLIKGASTLEGIIRALTKK
jgi:hypothetical protein